MGIESNLKPMTIVMAICGIPAASHSNSQNRFIKFILHLIVAFSLCLNFSYNMNSLTNELSFWIKYLMYPRAGNETVWDSSTHGFQVPGILMDFYALILNPLLAIMIPIMFSANYHFNGNWKRIWTIIQKMDQEMMLSDTFNQKSRKQCIINILLLFLFPPVFFEWLI